jgi:hypothetical protein
MSHPKIALFDKIFLKQMITSVDTLCRILQATKENVHVLPVMINALEKTFVRGSDKYVSKQGFGELDYLQNARNSQPDRFAIRRGIEKDQTISADFDRSFSRGSQPTPMGDRISIVSAISKPTVQIVRKFERNSFLFFTLIAALQFC